MTYIRPVIFVTMLFATILMFEKSKAEWCEAKSQSEPPVLETFNYAVDVFESWNNSNSQDLVLGNKIGALVSSYSFFIQKEDLSGFSNSTLKNLQRVIEILKAEDRVFQNAPLRERKEKYLQLEDKILKILECRLAERKKKVRHILGK